MFKTQQEESFLNFLKSYQIQVDQLKAYKAEDKNNQSIQQNIIELIANLNENSPIFVEQIFLQRKYNQEQINLLKTNQVLQYRIAYILWAFNFKQSSSQISRQKQQNQVFNSKKNKDQQDQNNNKDKLQSYSHAFAQQIINFLKQNRLVYSFDQKIFSRQSNEFGDNSIHNDHSSGKNQNNKIVELNLQKCKALAQLMKFLQYTQLLDEKSEINSKFKRIDKQTYKLQYMKQYCFLKPLQQNLFPNCQFFSNKKKHFSSKLTIDDIFQQKNKDYEWLQGCHNYIQWLFPNHHQSAHNDNCFPLSYLQSDIFDKDIQIGRRIITAIDMYLDFMGVEIYYSSSKKVRISKALNAENRLQNVLINYTHNHLRITRIIRCLSITGFRMVALAFIQFLDDLTHYESKYKHIRGIFQKFWKPYGELTNKIAKQNCYLSAEEFPQPHEALNEKFLQTKYLNQGKDIKEIQSQFRLKKVLKEIKTQNQASKVTKYSNNAQMLLSNQLSGKNQKNQKEQHNEFSKLENQKLEQHKQQQKEIQKNIPQVQAQQMKIQVIALDKKNQKYQIQVQVQSEVQKQQLNYCYCQELSPSQKCSLI